MFHFSCSPNISHATTVNTTRVMHSCRIFIWVTLITPLPKDGSVQPLSSTRVEAELLYNRVPFAKVLFMVCLTLGLVAFGRLVYRNLSGRPAFKHEHAVWSGLLYAVTLALLFAFGLRWYVAGHVPMSNGFETMQFMALATLVVSCLTHRRFGVMLPFGLILSGTDEAVRQSFLWHTATGRKYVPRPSGL